MMQLDDLASLLSDHLDGAVASSGLALKVMPTCIAPHKRSWEVRDGRSCIVSVTLSENEGMHVRLKHGVSWLHTISLGSKPPEPMMREVAGVVLAMLRRPQKQERVA